ncbi:glycoside hydrolase family 31 protein [Paracidobacterium acidisoli]|uniref:glycoside hydrolase family 31 protein n=1 Tax=Paracidobacterium acidisoli TaxID=2303751 RepID=UPI000E3C6F07|nr:DUF5110 domain-containing protein [Paracidobacterium acidisoli]
MSARLRRALAESMMWFLLLPMLAAPCLAQSELTSTAGKTGIVIATKTDTLRIEVCGASILHIIASPHPGKSEALSPTPWITGGCDPAPYHLSETGTSRILTTANIRLEIFPDGSMTFSDSRGNTLLKELGGRTYDQVPSESAGIYHTRSFFQPSDDEAIYGLGQHQSGMFNYRGSSVYLSQTNTDVAVPLFLSTKGYGVLWNTASSTLFDNRTPHMLIMDTTAERSIDYYFIAGPEPDQIIHGYRTLTGSAPMFGKWAYGLFQSKDRYKSQDELLHVAQEYRSKGLPLDTLVQDWHWWTTQGSAEFNAEYPDPKGMFAALHALHLHVMLSIWPTFDSAAPIDAEMRAKTWMLGNTDAYDATNPEAQNLYWKRLAGPLLREGVDAFWLDATEPELSATEHGIPPGGDLYLGRSALFSNIYPYSDSAGIYRNWRATTQEKRAFILTRSGFSGQQHNAAATWSGDVYSTFWSLERQIPAGLNFSISGIPYWTTDIGGYGYPSFKSTEDPAFRELVTRWFEFATFCPLFRMHGHRENNQNELWSFGDDSRILAVYDRLRYRMLPYIYSLAWKVTSEDYTLMRPLVMDWRSDRATWEIGDEYMFGPSLLVAPVTKSHATSRSLYLPSSPRWYDFWTGAEVAAGHHVADAPLDRIPLYVPAGTILPLGPEVQYAAQDQDAPLELRIYPGANGDFRLYEDAGDGYGYEHGERAIIPLRWDDAHFTLTIGAREGAYPGMAKSRQFRIILVRPGHGTGEEVTTTAEQEVSYSGAPVEVHIRRRN